MKKYFNHIVFFSALLILLTFNIIISKNKSEFEGFTSVLFLLCVSASLLPYAVLKKHSFKEISENNFAMIFLGLTFFVFLSLFTTPNIFTINQKIISWITLPLILTTQYFIILKNELKKSKNNNFEDFNHY